MSTTRMMNMSTLPPEKPAIDPKVMPMTSTMIEAKKPTASEMRVP